jgi:YNFM family putative membrane transporter
VEGYEIIVKPELSLKNKVARSNPKVNYMMVTILLSLTALMVLSSVYIMIPIVYDLSILFDVSIGKAAWSTSFFALFYAFGFLVFGPLSDRFGAKKTIVVGLAALSLCTLLISTAHSLELLLLFRSIQGFVAATFAPVALAYIFEIFPTQKRATSIAFLSTGYLAAGIFGQLLSSVVTGSFGWSYVFIFFSIMYCIASLLALIALPQTVRKQNIEINLFFIWKKMLRLLLKPTLLACYIITFTLLFSFVAMYASLGRHLTAVFGLTEQQIFLIRSLGIIGMIISPFTGRLINRFSLKKVLISGLSIAVGGLVLLWIMPTIILLAFSTIIFVTGLSLTFPAIMNLVGMLGGEFRSGATSLYTFILFIGASAGSLLVNIEHFKIIILLTIITLLVSLIISIKLKVPEKIY